MYSVVNDNQFPRYTKCLQDFHHPHQLQEQLGDCLYVDEKPRDLEQLLSDCKETLKYCVKTGIQYPSLMCSSSTN